ncbi:MAG: GNAT family N-acetyltransferase, partial [Acidimicrobiales bacterium]
AKGRWSIGARVAGRGLRVAPWQGDPFVALIGPVKSGRAPTSVEIHRCLTSLQQRGVYHAVTPALSPFEAETFFGAGFKLFERLHLLSCPVNAATDRPADASAKLIAGRSWHDRTVLEVDARAFKGFWRFDKLALAEAKTATPSRRYRVAKLNRKVVGYAVTGRAGGRGYLQRLAVDPTVQGKGIGKLLVADSFQWLRRRGADLSLVNTQETNTRALGLYESIGYRRQPEGLLVLRWDPGAR